MSHNEENAGEPLSHSGGVRVSDEEIKMGFNTRALHVGQAPDPITGAVCVPVSLATTFAQKSPGIHTGYEYSRTGNPTRCAFEKCVASLESARYGLAFASGSAATATIINMLNSGDHVICIDDVYGGTNRFFKYAFTVLCGSMFTQSWSCVWSCTAKWLALP